MFQTACIVALAALSLCILHRKSLYSTYASLKFLVSGRRMLIEAAERHKDTPFSMLIPGNRLHVVSSKEHWNDLNSTSINHLSSHAWSKQHFQPKYTFGYEWPDRRDVDGMPVVRAVRTMTNQFSELKQKFVGIMSEELDQSFQANILSDGSSKIPLWDTVKHFGSRMNMLVMFGEDVANNPITVDRGLKYIDETTLVGEAAKNLPTWLIPIAAWLIRGNNDNQTHILDMITNETQKYYDALASAPNDAHRKPKSILEALVQNLPEERYGGRIRFDMNTTFISSTTATPIMATQLLEDIYTHPKYLPALREEVKGILDDPSANMANLPLLESFLVESIRTHCFLATVIHRVPLRSYTFSDGYTVPAGEIVEFYQQKVMSDNSIYRDAAKFDPERFKGTGRTSCDMGMEWPFWGNSKLACPGRFHVTNVAKLIAIYFIMNYDAHFERTDNLSFQFRDVNVPNPAAKLILKRRGGDLE